MKTVDFLTANDKWIKVNKNELAGVKNFYKIKEVMEYSNGKIAVTYMNGTSIFYENIHGTYGFPVKVERY